MVAADSSKAVSPKSRKQGRIEVLLFANDVCFADKPIPVHSLWIDG
jgi:hypothetical protein